MIFVMKATFFGLLLTTILVSGVFVAPVIADAQTEGIVACKGLDCNFCTFVESLKRFIDLIFEIVTIVAVILLVIAGLKLATSGGNQAAMENAKSMLTNAVIGFVIVLAAWLMVDTMIKVLAGDSNWGMWNEFNTQKACGGVRILEGRAPTGAGPN